MEIKLEDGKCTIDINYYYTNIIITSNDPILFNLLSMMQKESIRIDDIYSSSSESLCIALNILTYDHILLIEQILGNINIGIGSDIQCIPFLKIKVDCDYLEESFAYYKECF